MPKKEYISKNYALYLVNYFGNMQTWSKEDIVSEIKRKIAEADVELPAADVSPVVRCKDCKWRPLCCRTIRTGGNKPDDFCSFGERKDG